MSHISKTTVVGIAKMQVATSLDTENGDMVVKRVSIPVGLEELMENLTKEVLVKKPRDIYTFASDYFAELLTTRDKEQLKEKNNKNAAKSSEKQKVAINNERNLYKNDSLKVTKVKQIPRQNVRNRLPSPKGVPQTKKILSQKAAFNEEKGTSKSNKEKATPVVPKTKRSISLEMPTKKPRELIRRNSNANRELSKKLSNGTPTAQDNSRLKRSQTLPSNLDVPTNLLQKKIRSSKSGMKLKQKSASSVPTASGDSSIGNSISEKNNTSSDIPATNGSKSESSNMLSQAAGLAAGLVAGVGVAEMIIDEKEDVNTNNSSDKVNNSKSEANSLKEAEVDVQESKDNREEKIKEEMIEEKVIGDEGSANQLEESVAELREDASIEEGISQEEDTPQEEDNTSGRESDSLKGSIVAGILNDVVNVKHEPMSNGIMDEDSKVAIDSISEEPLMEGEKSTVNIEETEQSENEKVEEKIQEGIKMEEQTPTRIDSEKDSDSIMEEEQASTKISNEKNAGSNKEVIVENNEAPTPEKQDDSVTENNSQTKSRSKRSVGDYSPEIGEKGVILENNIESSEQLNDVKDEIILEEDTLSQNKEENYAENEQETIMETEANKDTSVVINDNNQDVLPIENESSTHLNAENNVETIPGVVNEEKPEETLNAVPGAAESLPLLDAEINDKSTSEIVNEEKSEETSGAVADELVEEIKNESNSDSAKGIVQKIIENSPSIADKNDVKDESEDLNADDSVKSITDVVKDNKENEDKLDDTANVDPVETKVDIKDESVLTSIKETGQEVAADSVLVKDKDDTKNEEISEAKADSVAISNDLAEAVISEKHCEDPQGDVSNEIKDENDQQEIRRLSEAFLETEKSLYDTPKDENVSLVEFPGDNQGAQIKDPEENTVSNKENLEENNTPENVAVISLHDSTKNKEGAAVSAIDDTSDKEKSKDGIEKEVDANSDVLVTSKVDEINEKIKKEDSSDQPKEDNLDENKQIEASATVESDEANINNDIKHGAQELEKENIKDKESEEKAPILEEEVTKQEVSILNKSFGEENVADAEIDVKEDDFNAVLVAEAEESKENGSNSENKSNIATLNIVKSEVNGKENIETLETENKLERKEIDEVEAEEPNDSNGLNLNADEENSKGTIEEEKMDTKNMSDKENPKTEDDSKLANLEKHEAADLLECEKGEESLKIDTTAANSNADKSEIKEELQVTRNDIQNLTSEPNKDENIIEKSEEKVDAAAKVDEGVKSEDGLKENNENVNRPEDDEDSASDTMKAVDSISSEEASKIDNVGTNVERHLSVPEDDEEKESTKEQSDKLEKEAPKKAESSKDEEPKINGSLKLEVAEQPPAVQTNESDIQEDCVKLVVGNETSAVILNNEASEAADSKDDAEEKAALKIQSFWKRVKDFRSRQILSDLQKPSECDELPKDRLTENDIRNAAIVIQSLFRGYITRKELGTRKPREYSGGKIENQLPLVVEVSEEEEDKSGHHEDSTENDSGRDLMELIDQIEAKEAEEIDKIGKKFDDITSEAKEIVEDAPQAEECAVKEVTEALDHTKIEEINDDKIIEAIYQLDNLKIPSDLPKIEDTFDVTRETSNSTEGNNEKLEHKPENTAEDDSANVVVEILEDSVNSTTAKLSKDDEMKDKSQTQTFGELVKVDEDQSETKSDSIPENTSKKDQEGLENKTDNESANETENKQKSEVSNESGGDKVEDKIEPAGNHSSKDNESAITNEINESDKNKVEDKTESKETKEGLESKIDSEPAGEVKVEVKLPEELTQLNEDKENKNDLVIEDLSNANQETLKSKIEGGNAAEIKFEDKTETVEDVAKENKNEIASTGSLKGEEDKIPDGEMIDEQKNIYESKISSTVFSKDGEDDMNGKPEGGMDQVSKESDEVKLAGAKEILPVDLSADNEERNGEHVQDSLTSPRENKLRQFFPENADLAATKIQQTYRNFSKRKKVNPSEEKQAFADSQSLERLPEKLPKENGVNSNISDSEKQQDIDMPIELNVEIRQEISEDGNNKDGDEKGGSKTDESNLAGPFETVEPSENSKFPLNNKISEDKGSFSEGGNSLVEENASSLLHSSEIHDLVISGTAPAEEVKAERTKLSQLEVSSVPDDTPGILHSSEFHDSVIPVFTSSDEEKKNEDEEIGLMHSSEFHDPVISSEERKLFPKFEEEQSKKLEEEDHMYNKYDFNLNQAGPDITLGPSLDLYSPQEDVATNPNLKRGKRSLNSNTLDEETAALTIQKSYRSYQNRKAADSKTSNQNTDLESESELDISSPNLIVPGSISKTPSSESFYRDELFENAPTRPVTSDMPIGEIITDDYNNKNEDNLEAIAKGDDFESPNRQDLSRPLSMDSIASTQSTDTIIFVNSEAASNVHDDISNLDESFDTQVENHNNINNNLDVQKENSNGYIESDFEPQKEERVTISYDPAKLRREIEEAEDLNLRIGDEEKQEKVSEEVPPLKDEHTAELSVGNDDGEKQKEISPLNSENDTLKEGGCNETKETENVALKENDGILNKGNNLSKDENSFQSVEEDSGISKEENTDISKEDSNDVPTENTDLSIEAVDSHKREEDSGISKEENLKTFPREDEEKLKNITSSEENKGSDITNLSTEAGSGQIVEEDSNVSKEEINSLAKERNDKDTELHKEIQKYMIASSDDIFSEGGENKNAPTTVGTDEENLAATKIQTFYRYKKNFNSETNKIINNENTTETPNAEISENVDSKKIIESKDNLEKEELIKNGKSSESVDTDTKNLIEGKSEMIDIIEQASKLDKEILPVIMDNVEEVGEDLMERDKKSVLGSVGPIVEERIDEKDPIGETILGGSNKFEEKALIHNEERSFAEERNENEIVPHDSSNNLEDAITKADTSLDKISANKQEAKEDTERKILESDQKLIEKIESEMVLEKAQGEIKAFDENKSADLPQDDDNENEMEPDKNRKEDIIQDSKVNDETIVNKVSNPFEVIKGNERDEKENNKDPVETKVVHEVKDANDDNSEATTANIDSDFSEITELVLDQNREEMKTEDKDKQDEANRESTKEMNVNKDTNEEINENGQEIKKEGSEEPPEDEHGMHVKVPEGGYPLLKNDDYRVIGNSGYVTIDNSYLESSSKPQSKLGEDVPIEEILSQSISNKESDVAAVPDSFKEYIETIIRPSSMAQSDNGSTNSSSKSVNDLIETSGSPNGNVDTSIAADRTYEILKRDENSSEESREAVSSSKSVENLVEPNGSDESSIAANETYEIVADNLNLIEGNQKANAVSKEDVSEKMSSTIEEKAVNNGISDGMHDYASVNPGGSGGQSPQEQGKADVGVSTGDNGTDWSHGAVNGDQEAPIYISVATAQFSHSAGASPDLAYVTTVQIPSPRSSAGALRHTGEFHDSIPVSVPSPVGGESSVQDGNRAGSAGRGTPAGLAQTGDLQGNVMPLAVQLNQSPAGDEKLTSRSDRKSPTAASGSGGSNGKAARDAHAPGKDASAFQNTSEVPRAPSDSATMDNASDKRNNATMVQKNQEAEAATKIQASFRGYQVRKQLKNKIGGNEISNSRRSARRKSASRIEASKNAQKRYQPNELEEKSATKIQAGIRGFLVRKRQKNNKKNTTPESS